MRVLITGVDGYLGWPLALYLAKRGHEIGGIDNYLRRKLVGEMGSQSATPIAKMDERLIAFREATGKPLRFYRGDLMDYNFVKNSIESFAPEAIVYLGQIPSAPYSMMDLEHCRFTHENNVLGNLNILYAMKEYVPDCHLIKLGTMGEYGTPNVDIPEGFFDLEYRGRKDRLIFPRKPGSFYHLTKVHDSHNVEFACRIWGLRSTDIMQGVVYGTRAEEKLADSRLNTRFDFDQCFGTAINRFCAQAIIGHPLTPYGKGTQKRSFLPLRDSMQCLALAVENPAAEGEYRIFNQFAEVYSIEELAQRVKKVAEQMDLPVEVKLLENPRTEMEEHYYNPDHHALFDLGYQPEGSLEEEVRLVLEDLRPHKDRILSRQAALIPDIRWDNSRRSSKFLQ